VSTRPPATDARMRRLFAEASATIEHSPSCRAYSLTSFPEGTIWAEICICGRHGRLETALREAEDLPHSAECFAWGESIRKIVTAEISELCICNRVARLVAARRKAERNTPHKAFCLDFSHASAGILAKPVCSCDYAPRLGAALLAVAQTEARELVRGISKGTRAEYERQIADLEARLEQVQERAPV
jgi:hypothetical protein